MRIVITNATGDVGVVAARSLRLAGFEVHGVDGRRVPRSLACRHLSGYGCITDDDPRAGQDAVLRFIAQSRADVFLPLCTPGAVLAVQRRRELASLCRTNTPDPDAFLAAYDKRLCMEQCSQLGIPCARSLSRDEALAVLKKTERGSVVVKPTMDVSAANGIHYVEDAAHLDAAMSQCKSRYGDCMIQEYIPGSAQEMCTVTLVFSGTGRLAAAFTARKVRQWPPKGGVTACGTSTREQGLVDHVLPFFTKWRWRGPAEVELKRDERDGTFKVIEINPRFPGYLRLPSVCGVEMAVLAVRSALGYEPTRAVELSEYRGGVTYVAPTVFLRSVANQARVHGWFAEIAQARAEAAGSWPIMLGLLSDSLSIVARTFAPKRSPRSAPFGHTPIAVDPACPPAR
jgi:predicted ATP-grasp superfamily ATP-dependent carboligase